MFQTNVVEKIRTDIVCSVICFRKSCRVVYKSTVEWGTTQMTIWRMHIACSLPKATNTHSQYAVLTAFPLQQWLHEHASMLRYTYIAFVTCRPARGADWRTSALRCKVSVRDYRYVCCDYHKHVLQRSQHGSFVLVRQAVAWMSFVRIL